MKLIYLKSPYKSDSFDVSIGIKIPFCRVSVWLLLSRVAPYLQIFTTNCDTIKFQFLDHKWKEKFYKIEIHVELFLRDHWL